MSRHFRYVLVMLIALMGVIGTAGASLAAPQQGTNGDVLTAQGATGTVSASIYICDGQEGVVWGGAPGATCYAANASLVMYLIGDGTDDSWSVASGGSATVPAGTFEVYENVHWTMSKVVVTAGANTHVNVLLPGKALPPPPPPPPPAPATGTVSASIYICDGQQGVIWGGTPGATCYAANASLVMYLIGDGSDASWSVGSGGSATVPAGSHEVYENVHWTMKTISVPAGTTTYITVLLPGKALPPPPPPAPATGTVTMNKYICDGVSKVTWGGSPDANCDPAKASFYFYLIGDGTDDYWTLHVDGSGSRTLPVGTYEVYESGTWSMSKVTIEAGKTTTVNVLNPGKPLPPPPAPQGTVTVNKYICDGLDEVMWGGSPDANCDPAKATFYFYLIGDGLDTYQMLKVDGTGSIKLAPGTYEVYESGYWTMNKVVVADGKTTTVNVLNPGDPLPPPPPPTGEVEISKFECDDVTKVTWNGTPDADCDEGTATFYFYLIGDGTDDYWMLKVDGTDSIELPVGTYEVWEDGTWSMQKITVKDGETTHVDVLNPDD